MTDTMQPPAHHCTKPLLCAILEVRRTVQVFQPVPSPVCADTAQCTAMQVRPEPADTQRNTTYVPAITLST